MTAEHRRTRVPGKVDALARGSWQPTEISGCQVWLAADRIEGLADGAAVASWADLSGNSRNLVQASETLQPTYQTAEINGRPVVRFDGSNDYLSLSHAASAYTSLALVFVVKLLGTEATRGILSWATTLSSSGPSIMVQRNGATDVRLYVNGGYRITVSHSQNATRIHLVTWDGTTWRYYLDGGAASTYTGGINNSGTSIYLGNGYNGYPNIDLAEVALYNAVPSDGDRAILLTYLAEKYGVSL